MAKGFEIAEGYLDIEADVDHALRDVRNFFREVEGELEGQEKKFKKSGEESGKKLAEGLGTGADAKIESTFKKITERAMTTVEHESSRRGGLLGALVGRGSGGAGIGRSILGGLSGALRGARSMIGRAFSGIGSALSGLASGGSKLFSWISKGISEAFSSGLDQAKQIWENTSKVFQQIGNVGGGIGGILQVGAMALAVPLILGLAGALFQLSAALLAVPAGIAVLVAAIAPLMIAFKGFGEAVGAGLSGDVDKFNEALKGLTPSARTAAKEFVKLGPALKAIKTLVQESLFNQLIGQFSKLGTTLLPALATGLGGVAGALGHLIGMFIGLVSAPDTIKMLNNLFATTTRIVDNLAGPLVSLFGGVFALINAGLPWVEKFMKVLSGGLQAGADWLQKITGPGGQFTGWMERAWHIGVELWAVLKGLGEFAATLLGSLGDEGTDTLTGMADAIAKVNEYLKSAEGAETLHNLGVIVHWAGNAFVALLGATVSAYKGLNALFSFVRGIGPFFSSLWDNIVSGAKAVGNWFVWLGTTIWGGITAAASAVGGFFVMIWNGLVTAYNAVVSFGGMIVDWFVALPGKIISFISSLPGIIGGFFTDLSNRVLFTIGFLAGSIVKLFLVDVPAGLSAAWAWISNIFTTGINWIVALWNAFPGLVMAALSGFWGWLTGAFSAAWDWVKMVTAATINDLVSRAKALPGQVMGALSSFGSMIAGLFSSAWAWVSREVSAGINNMMNFVNSIPGKIKNALAGAGSWLVQAGRDMIRGLVSGIADTLSWAVDKARNAAHEIAEGFKRAIESHSPSQLMRREVGRWILPGVMKGMDDSKPKMMRYLGATADMISGGMRPNVNVAAPNVSVGGVTLIADLGDGIQRAVPVALMRNTDTVAAASNVGNRQRAGWTNTGRTVITAAS